MSGKFFVPPLGSLWSFIYLPGGRLRCHHSLIPLPVYTIPSICFFHTQNSKHNLGIPNAKNIFMEISYL